jgi:peroxiredoxin
MKMKWIFACATVALLLAGCADQTKERTVTARIEGAGGDTLYFDKFVDNRPVHLDSTVLDAQGNGVIHLPAMPLDFYALRIGEQNFMVLLLDSAESITVSARKDSMAFPRSIQGSVNSSLMHGHFAEAKTFDDQRNALVDRLRANPKDSAAMAEFATLNKTFMDKTRQFVQDHMSSPAVLAAMNRLNIQTELPLFVQVRDSLRRTIGGSAYFTGFRDQVDRMAQQADAARLQEEQQGRLEDLVPIGSPAPDFTQNSPEGRPISLSSLRGKVVLIDFWASWCRPCRMENPNVVKVYNTYRPKGFEILGVSLDRSKEAWLDAIKQDGLTWKHVSDLAFWNNAVAQQYGVSAIPYTVLVDRDGKVLAKNLRGSALEAKLAEVLQ